MLWAGYPLVAEVLDIEFKSAAPLYTVGELDAIVAGSVLVRKGELWAGVLLVLVMGNNGWDTEGGVDDGRPGGPTWNGG